MKNKLTRVDSGYNSGEAYLFECPGCGCLHMVAVSYGPEYIQRRGGEGPKWTFNGDLKSPTFSPSLLVRGKRPLTDDEHAQLMAGKTINVPDFVCHSFIRDGRIQFLGDCTHDKKGLTVPLADVEEGS